MALDKLYSEGTAVFNTFFYWTLGQIIDVCFILGTKVLASPWLAVSLLIFAAFLYKKWLYLSNMQKHGCSAAALYPHLDPVLGSDWMLTLAKAVKANFLLEAWSDNFSNIAQSYWYQSFGEWTLFTNEPENVKAVLATNFDNWAVQGPRQKIVQMTLGLSSILSVNGKEWKHSRGIIRPSFVRNHIADLTCLEKHVDNLLARIPHDGTTVDLQELFYMMTMDSSTEFM